MAAAAGRRAVLLRTILPMIAAAICHFMWSRQGGGKCGEQLVQPRREHLELPMEAREDKEELSMEVKEVKEEIVEVKEEIVPVSKMNMKSRSNRTSGDDTSSESVEPQQPTLQATNILPPVSLKSTEQATALFDKLKEEHDFAKAVKSDDAKVPVHIWDEGVFGQAPTEEEKRALMSLQLFCLRVYRRRLWKDVRAHLIAKFGREWLTLDRNGGQSCGLGTEIEAMQEILWRAAENDWFEYPMGSTLLHFRFSLRYWTQALEGVT